jgi:RNA polymerase sigma factor (sigma-70 family)
MPTEGFDGLFAAEYPNVVRTLVLMCHDQHRAEDLAQEAFVQLLRHWEVVGRFDRPGAWVRRVAVRLTLRSLQREGRRRRVERGFEPQGPVSPTDLDLVNAIRLLAPRQRAAIVLFYFEDLPLADVADVLGCSSSTAGVHLHRARAVLKAAL